MDLREKIADIFHKAYYPTMHEAISDATLYEATDQILTLFWEEVEKIENPFITEPPEQGAKEWAGFEHCCLVLMDKIKVKK